MRNSEAAILRVDNQKYDVAVVVEVDITCSIFNFNVLLHKST